MNFKRFFVNVFILIFSFSCIFNTATSASFYDYSGEKYHSFRDIDTKISFAKSAFENLYLLNFQTITPTGTVPSEILNELKYLYSLVCKNLFYLLKDSPQNYGRTFMHLSYVASIISNPKKSLRIDLTSEYYEDEMTQLYSCVIQQCKLNDYLPHNKKTLNLFDAILIYSYVFNECQFSPSLKALKEVLNLNKIDPETFLFYEE